MKKGFICLKVEKYGIIVLMHKNTIFDRKLNPFQMRRDFRFHKLQVIRIIGGCQLLSDKYEEGMV